MKKIIAKQLSLALVLALTAGAAIGCGTTKESSENEKIDASSAGTTAAVAEVAGIEGFKTFDKQVEIQIPVYDRAVDGLPAVDDNYWTQWVQAQFGDKYNIKVTYVAIPRTDEVTKMNMLIAAGDSPNLVFHYDFPAIVSYADQGALQEIDMEAFKQIAPTYYKNMEDNKILPYLKLNDKDMFIAAYRPINYSWTTFIRQDWIDKVGMEMPTNYTEYTALLDAWKAQGICEYPLGKSLPTTGYIPENYMFQEYPENEEDVALYCDLSVASLPWKPTHDYLLRTNTEYNKGYFSKEYYLDKDGSQMKADFIAGKIGIYGNYLASNSDYVSGLLANEPNAKLAVLDPYATLDEGQYPISRLAYPTGLIIGFSSQSTPEQVKAASMLLEWMAQPDNLFTLQNGIEGKTYTLDSSGLPVTQNYDGIEKLNYGNNKDMFALVIEGNDYGSDEANLQAQINTYAPKGLEFAIEENAKNWAETSKYGVYDYLFTNSLVSVTDNKATLLSKWQESSVALTTANPADFETLYTKLSKEYLDAGYQTILDEKKATYDSAK